MLALAIGIIVASIILARPLKKIASKDESISVTGSAKQIINSDLGVLKLSLISNSKDSKEAYNQILAQKPLLLAYLNKFGISADKITEMTLGVFEKKNYQYGDGVEPLGYEFRQAFEVKSNDVNAILKLSLEAPSLFAQGINIRVEPPQFIYTKISDVKVSMQSQAAIDAKNRAEKIAEATGAKIGDMTNARMGVIQITPRFSNDVSDYGMNDVSSIEKEITAVVSATFKLEK